MLNLYDESIRHESGTAHLARAFLRPIIAGGPPDLHHYVQETGAGWSVVPLNAGKLAEVLYEAARLDEADVPPWSSASTPRRSSARGTPWPPGARRPGRVSGATKADTGPASASQGARRVRCAGSRSHPGPFPGALPMSPRIYLSSPHLGTLERGVCRRDAFASNWIAPLGPHVDAFEAEFARCVGAPHALALSSGTAALHLALQLVGVGPGDEVLVSTLTFSATVNPIRYLGALAGLHRQRAQLLEHGPGAA